jgi:hypothetical protein
MQYKEHQKQGRNHNMNTESAAACNVGEPKQVHLFTYFTYTYGAWSGVVVKALRY